MTSLAAIAAVATGGAIFGGTPLSRDALLHPFREEHVASAVRRRPRPETLHQYLVWLHARLLEEYPERLHDQELGEGGTARINSEFLSYVDGSPFARDVDGSYRFPLRAALTLISRGPRNGSGNPFMARFLYAVSRGQTWDVASAAFAIPQAVAPIYALEALRRLFDAYTDFESHA